MAHAFKIFRAAEWSDASTAGIFHGSPDDLRDGYIHLSAKDQVAATAAKYFRGVEGLVLVAFDIETLGPTLKWEAARDGQLFPHLFGPLDMTFARGTWQLTLGPDGMPEVPPEIASC